jgi:negative regulator of sigma E activity
LGGDTRRIPLHEHLAFVGRVAEALGAEDVRISWSVGMAASVKFWPLDGRTAFPASDVSWSAMLAAVGAP